jgi:hypothetical protein
MQLDAERRLGALLRQFAPVGIRIEAPPAAGGTGTGVTWW